MAQSISVYLAVDDTLIQPEMGEESELFLDGAMKPQIGETLDMGIPDKRWKVTSVEAYRSEGQTVYVAIVAPADSSGIPDESEWRDGTVSMHISLSRRGDLPYIVNYGWNFDGKLPEKGRIFGYKLTDSGIESVPLDWVISDLETCLPDDEESSLYSAIHLCWCEKSKEVVAA